MTGNSVEMHIFVGLYLGNAWDK